MTKYDLSVIIPSIRPQNLDSIYFMLENAIQRYSFEVIVIGPNIISNDLWQKTNVRFVKDFGCPSRCVQLGSTLAEGKYLCWLSDDCTFLTPQSLDQCVTTLESCEESTGMTLRYFEGDGNGEFPLDYWRGKHHGDMKSLNGVNEIWRIAPLGMYRTSYFKKIGGLDCRYEHINMCTHDLAFRSQQNGAYIIDSPQTVARFRWSWHDPESKPVQRAYFETDRPLFEKEWLNKNERLDINYDNWMDSPSKWEKRFK